MIELNPSQPPLVRGGVNTKKTNFKFIPYNKKLISLARGLRRKRTETEIIFWNKISKDQELSKDKFTQQKPIDNFIADIYCSCLMLIIEIDGGIHQKLRLRDRERSDIILFKYGIKVIRLKNEDILNNVDEVIKKLKNKIKLIERELKSP